MFPVLAQGATYYVATTGSDSNSCNSAQSQSTPKLTINAGAGCLAAGDTLIVKAGTYDEVLPNVFPAGTAGNPTVVKSEVQYGAIIRPGRDKLSQLYGGFTLVALERSYLTFDGFTPGTIYHFQVRAVLHTNYTDWSEPVMKMCL